MCHPVNQTLGGQVTRSVEEFAEDMKKNLDGFVANMTHLDHLAVDTPENHMDRFLRWSEWQTDMHNYYWKV